MDVRRWWSCYFAKDGVYPDCKDEHGRTPLHPDYQILRIYNPGEKGHRNQI